MQMIDRKTTWFLFLGPVETTTRMILSLASLVMVSALSSCRLMMPCRIFLLILSRLLTTISILGFLSSALPMVWSCVQSCSEMTSCSSGGRRPYSHSLRGTNASLASSSADLEKKYFFHFLPYCLFIFFSETQYLIDLENIYFFHFLLYCLFIFFSETQYLIEILFLTMVTNYNKKYQCE